MATAAPGAALGPDERILIVYLSRQLALDADSEPTLLDDPEQWQSRLKTYLAPKTLEAHNAQWERIESYAYREARHVCDVWGRILAVIYFAVMIGCGAVGEAFFYEGPVSILCCFALIILSVPFLSRASVSLSAFGSLLVHGKAVGSTERRFWSFKEVAVFWGGFLWLALCTALFLIGMRWFAVLGIWAAGQNLIWISAGEWRLRAYNAAVRPFRQTAVKPITSSFLVASVGLVGASIAIGHALEATKFDARLPANLGWLPHAEARVYEWLNLGRGELALTVLLAMTAYLIEHVLGDLALTRAGLSEAAKRAEKAAKGAEKVSKRSDEASTSLHGTLDDLARFKVSFAEVEARLRETLEIKQFEALRRRADTLKDLSKELARQEGKPPETVGLMIAQDTASRRLDRFSTVMADLLQTVADIVEDKEGGREELYRINLITTAFEAAVESQNGLFTAAKKNGQHFEIVGPFEALALAVHKLVTNIQKRPPDMTEQATGRRVRFCTVFPLRPRDFFEKVVWTDNPLDGGKLEGSKAQAWNHFLNSLQSAAASSPEIIRHFIRIDPKLITEITKEVQTDLVAHLAQVASGERAGMYRLWNPIALESEAFLLSTDRIDTDLRKCFVQRTSGEGTAAWGASEDEPKRWRIHIHDSRDADVPPGKWEPLDLVLQEYHSAASRDGHGSGLRAMSFGLDDWNDRSPAPNSPLRLILQERGAEWMWVDYFAAYLDCEDGDKRWVFAIKSDFDAERGVVNMHLRFPGQDEWLKETVPQLDELFGIGSAASRRHISAYDFDEHEFKPCPEAAP